MLAFIPQLVILLCYCLLVHTPVVVWWVFFFFFFYSACTFIFTLPQIHSLLFLHTAFAIPLNVITYRSDDNDDLSPILLLNYTVGNDTTDNFFCAALKLDLVGYILNVVTLCYS
jgi:hypothetical protein